MAEGVDLELAALLAILLVVLLFVVAALVESRSGDRQPSARLRRHAYTLALGVYCSSWTFYGAVGSAVSAGWNYLPIYLAPVTLLLLAPRFLERLAQAVADEQASSVSDFIAARFGHDITVARLVTMIALLGTIPYIALQLRSIGNAMAVVSGSDVAGPSMIAAAALLGLFAVLFGTRRYELAGRSEGLVFAIGLESIIKIVALILVAALALFTIANLPERQVADSAAAMAARFQPELITVETGIIFLISTMAIIVLPRQFYMGLVEARSPEDLPRARFGVAAYVGSMALLILPIALAGIAILPASAAPDIYVLGVPLASGSVAIGAVALLGGVSAGASMAIVDATALSTMISNDLLLPSLLRRQSNTASGSLGRQMLAIRRISVMAVMLLALTWALLVAETNSLASIGLIAFAAMAQFTPHLILGVLGSGRDPLAARASLAVGLALWLYTLALPPVAPTALLDTLAPTPLDPLQLFSIGGASPLVHGVLWSLGANLAVFGLVSARTMRRPTLPNLFRLQRNVRDQQGLKELTASFVGRERAEREFAGVEAGAPINRRMVQRAQELIATVIGASPAHTLVTSALTGGTMSLPEVTRLLDEGGQSLRFSRQLLASTFENIDAGISVVDVEMNLVAWNSRYLDLFDYPPGLVRAGTPVADLIRHNASRGDFGPGDVEHHVAKRLEHLRRGDQHSFERLRADGRVIKTVGGPMPGGGYVMSFLDITEEARVRAELETTLAELEARVEERTQELTGANARLAAADREKTRFLAAASHDLLQPLHVARLFSAALRRDEALADSTMVGRIEEAIVAADALLRALLDISKIDAGGVVPRPEAVELRPFLEDLVEGFRPLAAQKGLNLRLAAAPGVLATDPGLLRSVIQNFVSNAIRYTQNGGVLVGVRRRGQRWRIDVIDTGVGIPETEHEAVFGEFTRLGAVEVEGLGLGLALSRRIARLLGGEVELASVPGCGSRFSLYLPLSETLPATPRSVSEPPRRSAAAARSLTVLVVDNEQRIVEATAALLERFGHVAVGANTIAGALAIGERPDAVLADYRLDDGENGLNLIALLRERWPGLPAMIVTASSDERLPDVAALLGAPVIAKPADPAVIERFLADVSMTQVEAE